MRSSQHPNTPEHHISWIELYFISKGKDVAYYLGRAEFDAHGEEQMYSEPVALFRVAFPGAGTLRALAHCNVHGLWEGKRRVEVK